MTSITEGTLPRKDCVGKVGSKANLKKAKVSDITTQNGVSGLSNSNHGRPWTDESKGNCQQEGTLSTAIEGTEQSNPGILSCRACL